MLASMRKAAGMVWSCGLIINFSPLSPHLTPLSLSPHTHHTKTHNTQINTHEGSVLGRNLDIVWPYLYAMQQVECQIRSSLAHALAIITGRLTASGSSRPSSSGQTLRDAAVGTRSARLEHSLRPPHASSRHLDASTRILNHI